MKFFKNKLAVTIVLLSVGFLIFIGVSYKRESVSIVESAAGAALNPVQGVIYKFGSGTKNFFDFFINFTKIKDDNVRLSQLNTDLQTKLMEYQNLKNENASLKEMLNFKNSIAEYQYKGCDIIGKIGSSWVDGFIIDLGSKDGITAGMVVVTGKGLVGQVTSAADNWAKVLTISSENIQVSGIDQSTRDDGIVKGYIDDYNNQMSMIYALPLDSAIQKGDIITTSGKGNFYPKDIRIGEVTSVEDDKGKIQKTAVIKPYVDFNKLEELWVIIPKDLKNIKY
jgi:rod shape-determining protein MreC